MMYQLQEGKAEEHAAYAAKNTDGYGGAVLSYANRWGLLMEEKIKSGELDITKFADKTSHDADTEGMTGFMYGCAVQELSYYWVFGEVLRKWHNKEYGHDGEGVVNPALLTISVPIE